MDIFLHKYAEFKIDVIDEQDRLEGEKVQMESGLDADGKYEEYERNTDEEAVDEDNYEESENSEGDTDEEAVDEDNDEEAVEDDDGKMVKQLKKCVKVV